MLKFNLLNGFARYKDNLFSRIKKTIFIFTVVFFSLHLVSLVLMIIFRAGNIVINAGMLIAALIYFCVFLLGTRLIKDRSTEKSFKRAGKLFYKYSKYFLSFLNILFLIMAIVNLGVSPGRILVILNIVVSSLWLAFRIWADITLFWIKRKLLQLKDTLAFWKQNKESPNQPAE